jgi:hypothetical protein
MNRMSAMYVERSFSGERKDQRIISFAQPNNRPIYIIIF